MIKRYWPGALLALSLILGVLLTPVGAQVRAGVLSIISGTTPMSGFPTHAIPFNDGGVIGGDAGIGINTTFTPVFNPLSGDQILGIQKTVTSNSTGAPHYFLGFLSDITFTPAADAISTASAKSAYFGTIFTGTHLIQHVQGMDINIKDASVGQTANSVDGLSVYAWNSTGTIRDEVQGVYVETEDDVLGLDNNIAVSQINYSTWGTLASFWMFDDAVYSGPSFSGAGTLPELGGLHIGTPTNTGGGTITTVYGVKVEDQTAGSTNYAIYTGAGAVRLGSANAQITLDGVNLPLLNATGGASQVLKQTSSGGAVTVAQLACADLSDAGSGCSSSGVTGAALTRTNDTNVTLALGGTPTTALLQATSLTLGWTGQLGLSRGGTNADLSATGGTSRVLKQTSMGAAVTVAQLACADLSDAGGGCTGSAAPSAANPSASLGLAAVNGSAATFLRSDGAPALSQAIVPTWTGVHTWTLTQAANTSTDGLVLADTTAATAANQQFSPRLRFTGQGWKTTATAASQTVDWIIDNRPVQGTANPTSVLAFSSQINGGGYTNVLTFGNASGTITNTSGAFNPTLLNVTGFSGTPAIQISGTGIIGLTAPGTPATRVTLQSLGLTSAVGSAPDVILERDTAAVLGIRNATTAQTLRVYNTWTDASNGEWATFNFASNVFHIGATKNGTGTARVMTLDYGGTTTAAISIPITSGDITIGGNVFPTGYKSSDGTAGATTTCTIAGLTSITVKNGLITACS